MAAALDRLCALLAKGPAEPANVFNPWRDTDERDGKPRREMPKRRLDNLAAYLEARRTSARIVLMGEAPSHRGCRFSGIPFCSEHELVHRAGQVARRPLLLTSADAGAKPFTERSAAVIWGEMVAAGAAYDVVLWNTYPWHPYGDDVTSNRKPRPAEVREGHAAYEAFRACFTQPLQVLAVGKVAEQALGQWPGALCAGYIRHPAHGGEALFRQGFREHVMGRAPGGKAKAMSADKHR